MSERAHIRRTGPDDGAMLIFALLIITVIALVTGTLLVQGGTNFQAQVGLRDVAGRAYAADAAAKLAVNDLEQGSNGKDVSLPSGFVTPWVFDNNIDGTGCFGATGSGASLTPRNTITLPGMYTTPRAKSGPKTATVVCEPVPGTGIFGTAPGANNNGTGRAVTVLDPASDALIVNPQGTGNGALFQIHGDIAVAGGIQVPHGVLFTTGSVSAHPCPPASQINADGPCTDSGGSVTDPLSSRDPDITSVPSALGTWGACSSGVRTFQPGYYDDVVSLQAATDGCAKSVFVPGRYYFDFHNNSSDPTFSQYAMTGGSDTWTVSNTLVGGNIAGGTSGVPGACRNPIDKPGNDGVQFIFGGDSRLSLGMNANVELCASGLGPTQPIAIYGLDGSTAAKGQLSAGYAAGLQRTPTITANSVTSSISGGQPDFKPNPGTATLKDSVAAVDTITAAFTQASGNSTPTLTLSGFTPGTAIPKGALLTAASITVRHKEAIVGSTGNPAIAPHLKVTVGSATNVDLSSQLTNTSSPAGTPMTTDTVNLASNNALMQQLAAAVHSGDISGLSMAFSETAKGNSNASVDAIQVRLTYYVPTWRGATSTAIPGNCVATLGCNLVVTGNGSSYKGAFVVQGALYAPGAKIDLSLGNQTSVVSMRWGLVARKAVLGSLNQFPFAYPVVSIPETGPGFGAYVTAADLKVFLCAGAGPCPTGGTPDLTARVKMTDPVDPATGLVTPAPGTRKIEILSWAEQR